jgi:hypothetical protein
MRLLMGFVAKQSRRFIDATGGKLILVREGPIGLKEVENIGF